MKEKVFDKPSAVSPKMRDERQELRDREMREARCDKQIISNAKNKEMKVSAKNVF